MTRTPKTSSQKISARHPLRAPTPQELDAISWLKVLTPDERERTIDMLVVGNVAAGEHVCRVGRAATLWFGVIDGLLKVSSDDIHGNPVTFAGIPSGSWFGEGTALKRESYRYNVQALRKTTVAGLPIEGFHWLLEHSIGFNRFVIFQINERLSQFVAAREVEATNRPNLRVARGLAAMLNPVLNPRAGDAVRITQQELGYLVGLSRQRVNQALADLQTFGVLRVEYGGVRILDLAALQTHDF